MGKVIIVLLLGFGTALYFPKSRAVVFAKAAPVVNPVLAWRTRGEMRRIAVDLDRHERETRTFPGRPLDFSNWVNNQYHDENSDADAWGTRYELRAWADSFALLSLGPDGARGTDDDILIGHPRPFGRGR